MLNQEIENQSERLKESWGEGSAEAYLEFQNNPKTDDTNLKPVRDSRWISNTKRQPKKLNNFQATYIKALQSAGLSCRNLGALYGISQGTVSAIGSSRGAYKEV